MRRVGVLILLALAVATGVSGIALAEHAADGTPGAVWDAPDDTAADSDLNPLSDVLQEDDDADDEDDEEREDEDEHEAEEDDEEDEEERDDKDEEGEDEREDEEGDEQDDEYEVEEDEQEREDDDEEREEEEDEEDGRRGNNEPNGNSHNNGQNGDNGRNGNNGNRNNGRNGNNGNGQQGAAGQDDQDDDRAGRGADRSDDDGDEKEGEEDVETTAEDETEESDGNDEDEAVGDETGEQDEDGTGEQDEEETSEQDEKGGDDGRDDGDGSGGAGDSDEGGQDDGDRGGGAGDSQDDGDTAASIPSSVNRSASATATPPSGEATFSVPTATLGKTSMTTGETVRIRLRVENTGEREGSYEVVLRVDAARVATESVTVGPGGTETIVFNYQVDDPGEYEIAVGERSLGTLTVTAPSVDGAVTTPDNGSVDVRGTEAVEVAEATTADDWVREGYETTVRATVVNTSNRTVTRALTVTVDGQPVANRSVTLQSGERDEVTIAFDAVNGTVAVEGVDAGRIAVGERFGGTETRIDGTAEGTGLWAEFGLAVFLGVLISAGALGLGKE